MISNIRASEHFVIFESEGKRYNVPIENVPGLWFFYHERVKAKQSEDQHAVPSKQLAEQAIAGMAELVRELNELRKFKAGVPWMCIRDAAYGNTKAAERVQAWWRANNPNLTANAPKEPHA